MLFKKKSNEFSQWLKENAPALAFWVASVILILFDLRVLDVVYNLTDKSVLLAVGAIFTTALMFFVWKNSFQYTLASKTQTSFASVGMALSLLATAVFGGMDYFVRGGLKIGTGGSEFSAVDLIFWGIPVLSIIHVVMLLAYWYFDPVVAAERKRREADDDHKFTEREMKHAGDLLEKQTAILSQFVVMAQTYGKKAALDQLDILGIERAPFEGIDVPGDKDKGPGHGSLPGVVHDPSMTSAYPEMIPVPVTAGSNGHGKIVNPT